MNRRAGLFSVGVLLSSLFFGTTLLSASEQEIGGAAPGSAGEAKVTVLNPRGKAPSIPLVPLAPRLNSLEGKTVYFVDVRFPGGDNLLRQIMEWFSKNYPNVKTVFREKTGPYMDGDPKLWAEIKEKGDAMVMAIGH